MRTPLRAAAPALLLSVAACAPDADSAGPAVEDPPLAGVYELSRVAGQPLPFGWEVVGGCRIRIRAAELDLDDAGGFRFFIDYTDTCAEDGVLEARVRFEGSYRGEGDLLQLEPEGFEPLAPGLGSVFVGGGTLLGVAEEWPGQPSLEFRRRDS